VRLAHPLHLHGRQFRVLMRQVDPAFAEDWESLREGFTDEGWKDTVLVMPGERVQILVHFTRYSGLFLYHCHNLEHEDMGMMRNYRVVARAG
jgi:FtsP/CotA-like multicopper oxidase with cupredoxin domain